MSPERVETEVDGRACRCRTSTRCSIRPPASRRRRLLDYYARIAEVMLPHLEDRPVTFRRFPDGVSGKSFYEKHVPVTRAGMGQDHHGPVRQRRSRPERGRRICGRDGHADADLGGEPRRPSSSTCRSGTPGGGADPGPPDHLVFDLDPGPGTSIVECCRVALWSPACSPAPPRASPRPAVPRVFSSSHAPATTDCGSSPGNGLIEHRAGDRAKSTAAGRDEHAKVAAPGQGPDRLEPEQSVQDDGRRVLAARRPEPTVSTPVTWDEVRDCERSGDPGRLRFAPGEVASAAWSAAGISSRRWPRRPPPGQYARGLLAAPRSGRRGLLPGPARPGQDPAAVAVHLGARDHKEMKLRGQAAVCVLGAIARAVEVHDRRPVAVLKVLVAFGARLDDQDWLWHEGSFHPPDVSPGGDSLPLAGRATGPIPKKSSGPAASASPRQRSPRMSSGLVIFERPWTSRSAARASNSVLVIPARFGPAGLAGGRLIVRRSAASADPIRRCPRLAGPGDGCLQGRHEVDDIRLRALRLEDDRLPVALAVDQFLDPRAVGVVIILRGPLPPRATRRASSPPRAPVPRR